MAQALGEAERLESRPGQPKPKEKRSLTPWLLLLPGALWLAVFFIVPLYSLVATSLYDPSGGATKGYEMTWHFENYWTALTEYSEQLIRSLWYAGLATFICLLLGYPLAYAIAFKAGRWRNLMLVLVIAPFFTSFLIRTLAWKQILGDQGVVVDIVHAVPFLDDVRLLFTPFAVICGLVYNFLPFMVLPLYASLEKIDPRLIEAAGDLYASPIRGFFKVTFPLSLAGVVAGTLLTFIPAAGDYINAQLLGNTQTRMIGSEIQNLFTAAQDYPTAGALSVLLMVLIVAMVIGYVRKAGTEDLV
jgi:spermidine/putrescine transport system permease protein